LINTKNTPASQIVSEAAQASEMNISIRSCSDENLSCELGLRF
jgi:hypothetical protein